MSTNSEEVKKIVDEYLAAKSQLGVPNGIPNLGALAKPGTTKSAHAFTKPSLEYKFNLSSAYSYVNSEGVDPKVSIITCLIKEKSNEIEILTEELKSLIDIKELLLEGKE